MTEITEHTVKLADAVERFILQWGDLGGTWGVNRSVSQIQARLYLSERPMTAEELADELGMARSNVSTSLKELLSLGLARRVPVKGDRRDHFEAETDLWDMAAKIAAARKAREIDPALDILRQCLAQADKDAAVHPVARQRLKAMHDFTAAADRWYGQMLGVPRGQRDLLLKLGGKIAAFLPGGKK